MNRNLDIARLVCGDGDKACPRVPSSVTYGEDSCSLSSLFHSVIALSVSESESESSSAGSELRGVGGKVYMSGGWV